MHAIWEAAKAVEADETTLCASQPVHPRNLAPRATVHEEQRSCRPLLASCQSTPIDGADLSSQASRRCRVVVNRPGRATPKHSVTTHQAQLHGRLNDCCHAPVPGEQD
jgi:hypothetical protein